MDAERRNEHQLFPPSPVFIGRMFWLHSPGRWLVGLIAGKPTVICTCHPVKNPTPDNKPQKSRLHRNIKTLREHKLVQQGRNGHSTLTDKGKKAGEELAREFRDDD